MEELADKFGCSRRHLSRLFHQRFGLSVATLRMEMRLLKASSLLRDPGVKVINVAEQCGFNHLGLFNTCFKRRFGLTPGVWRNTLNEKSQESESKAEDEICPLQVNGICPMLGKGAPHILHSGTAKSAKSPDIARTYGDELSPAVTVAMTTTKANHALKQTPLPGSSLRPNVGRSDE